MIKKALIIFSILLFSCINVYGKQYKSIEIFDINKNNVIKNIESSSEIEKQVKNYLQNIKGIYGKFNPIPDKGYMIKIPLDTPIAIQNTWISSFIDEVIMIFPENEPPYLMVLDNEERSIFLSFNGDTNTLLKYLNFNAKNSITLSDFKLKST
ncbi:hypothetical protein BD780_001566 [Clostridium tetanomorphum]|uniref:Lipoprotein n=1 Tax=Clostridium tetanomorphum TaxID=1553 RepID=A0A923J0J6_CLOTT|nr:hypothetical protein [Clostridium tetanomorphum]KAJ49721.1 hypothetical protein CTM_21578 [Clostridium tetanomorphum DSM 665]KAJ52640.1 hypothetical protein CTM_06631 [Clostridium tetanomorphum DSM 665]MBC2396805.1 hypothetical protein [Clostridium tetanomorphum]MBP1863233.1 hypothetical protein [Clostridium tetanomorphum]NRS84341.1 hypothetical protein [Clostridium tetanomorphum]